MRSIVALRHVDPAAWAAALRKEWNACKCTQTMAEKHGVSERTVWRWLAALGEHEGKPHRARKVHV